MYKKFTDIASKFMTKAQMFRYGFNLSPMYRRSTGRVVYASEDLKTVKIKIKRTYKNKNYVGSIFGGSLFSATDPIFMIQLIWIMGKQYVVWDKAATIRYKKPAYESCYGDFIITDEDVETIKKLVKEKGEIDYHFKVSLHSKDGVTFCEVDKVLYIADRNFYKNKKRSIEKKN